MWKRLFDEDRWHGKVMHGVLAAPKVFIVLVFFFGVFVVIAADSVILRLRRMSMPKGAAPTGGGPSRLR